MKTESKELTVVTDYLVDNMVLSGKINTSDMAELIGQIAPEGLNEFDLMRIKVPAGGGISWEIPNDEDADQVIPTQEIIGVVAAQKDVRAYWADKYTGAGTSPECASGDMQTGIGDPGGSCLSCPNAQFGSAIDDDGNFATGQACKHMKVLFVLQRDSILPLAIVAPPTSIKGIRSFMLRMAGKGQWISHLILAIGLEKDKNKQGTVYSKIKMRKIGVLGPDESKQIDQYAKSIAPLVGNLKISDLDE